LYLDKFLIVTFFETVNPRHPKYSSQTQSAALNPINQSYSNQSVNPRHP